MINAAAAKYLLYCHRLLLLNLRIFSKLIHGRSLWNQLTLKMWRFLLRVRRIKFNNSRISVRTTLKLRGIHCHINGIFSLSILINYLILERKLILRLLILIFKARLLRKAREYLDLSQCRIEDYLSLWFRLLWVNGKCVILLVIFGGLFFRIDLIMKLLRNDLLDLWSRGQWFLSDKKRILALKSRAIRNWWSLALVIFSYEVIFILFSQCMQALFLWLSVVTFV